MRKCLNRPPLARRSVTVLLAFVVAVAPAALRAEKADRDKPIQVESDRMVYDEGRRTNEFSGRVILTKGTIEIRADRILLREDKAGGQFATATGKPARFRQKREGVDEHFEGEALRLEYDSATEVVRLKEKASMRKLEGARVADEVFGNLIVYESRKEYFTVEGGGAANATPANPGGRVRVIIKPKGSAPPPAPGKRTSQPLRTDSKLQGLPAGQSR